jgi:hypothetical protein
LIDLWLLLMQSASIRRSKQLAMPAYLRKTVSEFIASNVRTMIGDLTSRYAEDGFSSQYTKATVAWEASLPLLQTELKSVLRIRADAASWTVLVELPLYRLRKRLDFVLLAADVIVVIEVKVGASQFSSQDIRQVDEYALDLRDFHELSQERRIFPILWCTKARTPPLSASEPSQTELVSNTGLVGEDGLAARLSALTQLSHKPINGISWDNSRYKPVPTIVEAATAIFSGHGIRQLANFDADNLQDASQRLVELIAEARSLRKRYLVFLAGVPGSGKTLAGLNVVHSSVEAGVEEAGDIVYLSGNTPLVLVLREALAQDEYGRGQSRRLADIRRETGTRIQHINDFLQDNVGRGSDSPPTEHVIVFDEAQRAWDERQGEKKFKRVASEPELLLEIMEKSTDWSVCICLVGGGQEINAGENGVAGWGDALRKLASLQRGLSWTVVAPKSVLDISAKENLQKLGPIPFEKKVDERLNLVVPMRSFRAPSLSDWINAVLDGNISGAQKARAQITHYEIALCRTLSAAKNWLRSKDRGLRRYGLVASSGARRLRADGLGEILQATDRDAIAHWYLQKHGDIRSSFALEVPANEYTCQGLELDFAGICWGGDLIWSPTSNKWIRRSLMGPGWNVLHNDSKITYVTNSYRVLLSRSREGMVIWVPHGCASDKTRDPTELDSTALYLQRCGAIPIDN